MSSHNPAGEGRGRGLITFRSAARAKGWASGNSAIRRDRR